MTIALLLMLGVLLSFGITIYILGGIELILTMLFPYQDIYRDGTQDIYLRRFYIYPRNKDFKPNEFKPRIYLHKFYRGDEDPHLHDHPWPYTSLILTQGYFEETPVHRFIDSGLDSDEFLRSKLVDSPDGRTWRRRVWYKPFTLLKRPATWKHRVILDGGKTAWTLIRTGPKERSWGFWLDEKSEFDFCPWRQYDQGVCYCTPEEKMQYKESNERVIRSDGEQGQEGQPSTDAGQQAGGREGQGAEEVQQEESWREGRREASDIHSIHPGEPVHQQMLQRAGKEETSSTSSDNQAERPDDIRDGESW